MSKKIFLFKDKSGRGCTSKVSKKTLLAMDDEEDLFDTLLHDFAENAEEGDEWENRAFKLTRL